MYHCRCNTFCHLRNIIKVEMLDRINIFSIIGIAEITVYIHRVVSLLPEGAFITSTTVVTDLPIRIQR